MLGKLLLTFAVIVIAFVYVRHQDQAKATLAKKSKSKAKPSDNDSLSGDMRIAAYMFLALTVGLGGALYYFRWQDDHTIVTVTLHRENQAQAIRYEVYKYQLRDRSFITVQGTSVTVASSERMEVTGLDL